MIELGPDSAAPGALIVVEAKEKDGYTLAQAREEIETARKNRGADWGVFVFSKKTAPPNLEPFSRYGNDFIVVWDAEDPSSDVFLKAGIIAARALCFRTERQSAAQQVDFETIDKAILEIEKRAGNLDEVRKSAETIQSSSDKDSRPRPHRSRGARKASRDPPRTRRRSEEFDDRYVVAARSACNSRSGHALRDRHARTRSASGYASGSLR